MPDRDHRTGFPAHLWLDRFRAALPRGSTILDLGCGGGEPIARYLIDHGFHITGIDRDVAMIDLARTRFPRESWTHADMRTIALDTRFDGIILWNSLDHLPHADQIDMVERAALWLNPGGRLLFTGVDEAASDHSAAIARHGLIEMAHVAADPASGGMDVWLARKA